MSDLRDLLGLTAALAADFYDSLPDRRVFPSATADELRAAFVRQLPEGPTDPRVVVSELNAAADPGLVAEPSGRYFGFVIGGSLPVTVATDWLLSAWDQLSLIHI